MYFYPFLNRLKLLMGTLSDDKGELKYYGMSLQTNTKDTFESGQVTAIPYACRHRSPVMDLINSHGLRVQGWGSILHVN